jgi:hypothetical protein
MQTLRLSAHYYGQYGADYTKDVPAEGYLGWKTAPLDISFTHTALVVMHAWDIQPKDQSPAGYSECEYLPRADAVCRNVLPGLLSAARQAGFNIFHVVARPGYYEHLPGYRRALALAGPEPARPAVVPADPVRQALDQFRWENVWPGKPNIPLYEKEKSQTRFHPGALPQANEGIAATSHQLAALCIDAGVNHLVYTGFTIGGCLLISPAGMVDMQRRGVMCSVLSDAVTAIENKETAHQELSKQLELWRVALTFGFVFDSSDLIKALAARSSSPDPFPVTGKPPA